MRRWPALLASVIAHAIALGLVLAWLRDQPSHVAPALPATPEAAPIDVAVLDEPPLPGSAAQASGPADERTVRSPDSRGGRGTSHGGGNPESGSAGSSTGKSSALFKMRGAELVVPADFIAKFLLESKPLVIVAKTGKLEDSGRGGHEIRDRVTTISVDKDGGAHLHDKPDVDIHFLRPELLSFNDTRHALGRMLQDWYRDPEAGKRAGTIQDLPKHLTAVPGACDQWGDPMCDPGGSGVSVTPDHKGLIIPIIGGNLDVTSALMRRFHVGDAYAARKLALLDSTRDERAEIGERHLAHELDHSAELMQRNLEQLWRTIHDPSARRAALFTLWDECAEGEGSLGEAGDRARVMVIGWIRAHLPAGSAGAFTPAELTALAARRTSKQPFVPYED